MDVEAGNNVKWTRMPLAFANRGPYLFLVHFNSVEVSDQSASPNDNEMSLESLALPPSVLIEMSSPCYLGPAPQPGSNYFFTNDNKGMDIVQLKAPVVVGETEIVQPVNLDDISFSGSEFSITPSIAKFLDQPDDSSECPSVGGSSNKMPFKRIPSVTDKQQTR